MPVEETPNTQETQQTQTPPPSTGTGNTPGNQGDGTIALTTFQLNERTEQAKRVAREELLKELGFEPGDKDALKTLVADAKKRADGEKTELQKAQDDLAKVAKKFDETQAALNQLQAERIADKVTAVIVDIASKDQLKAQYPADVAKHIRDTSPDKFSQLWKDGEVDAKAAKTLVEEVKKARPLWFQMQGVGSPSNRNGQNVEPNTEEKKQAAARQAQSIRSRF